MAPKRKDDTEIPGTIERSDPHARAIWKKTHASAVETYGEGAAAHKVAFAALKHQYKKEGDRWVKKAHKGPSDPQAARSTSSYPSSLSKHPAPTAGGKVAKTPAEARAKAKEAKREYAREYRKRKTARAA